MKLAVAGAGGYLGSRLVQVLNSKGYDVVGMDLRPESLEPIKDCLKDSVIVDVTKPETIEGKLEGIDTLISTIGLEFANKNLTYMDVDYQGNLNLIKEAEKAGVKKYMYVSVLKPPGEENGDLPAMVKAKRMLEEELKNSKLQWVIFRPTGYFKDFVNIFIKSAKEGKLRLIGDGEIRTNPLHPDDFSEFIADNLDTVNEIKGVGGPETYSYNELGNIAFEAAGNPPKFKYTSPGGFRVFMKILKLFRPTVYPILQFTLWCMTNDMSAPQTGKVSVKEALSKV